ncbi:fungal-specific transcription factor [Halenospora varia]|nr:fungal-specific transcription factor [Halenospora varia]
MPAVPRGSFSSGAAIGQGNSVSDGSDEASPSSNRVQGGFEGGYNDDFGLDGGAVDGSDLGSRTKEEKNDPNPPWSELKTKAGKERKRLPLACIACRRKKIRCSGEKPACKHCLRSRIPCVYKVTTRKAAPRTDYMAMLDKRLKRMEERIIKIVPKEEQQDTSAITRAAVKPTIPGAAPARSASAKKRNADEAFGAELDNWSKTPSGSQLTPNAKPTSLMIQEAEDNKLLLEGADSLPSKDIQEHLAEIFFENVYGQTYHVLHKPSFMSKLKRGQIPPVLVLAVCAISARFSTHPKLNTTPNFLRGEEWASEARSIAIRRYEWPNITILTCLLILGLHEFGTCQGGRSWALGGMAIRMAYALQLHADLEHDPNVRNGTIALTFIDREIRRRTMWACFLMDRFNSSGTDRPTFIKEESIKVQLPIKEMCFQMDMPGWTENLEGVVPHHDTPGDDEQSDAKANLGVAAYMIRSIALWGRIINHVNLGGKERDPEPIWNEASMYAKLTKQAEAFNDDLPENLQYTKENLHIHETEGLANQFLFLHIAIQQNMLFLGRYALGFQHSGGERQDNCEGQRKFGKEAKRKAFQAANRISEILKDAESHFVTAPFAGYCAFLASTMHILGSFAPDPEKQKISKMNLTINIKYLSKMKKYWGMFHFMLENLKDMYRNFADAARKGASEQTPSSAVFQYGDWFDRYPHGVSQSDFEDPSPGIKKEKGDDAVLEQKPGYHTVEEFFQTLSPLQAQDANSKVPKRKARKSQARQEQMEPVNTNMANMGQPQNPQMQMNNHHQMSQNYNHNQMSPTTPLYTHNQGNYYSHDVMIPPHQQNMMAVPQLDRQLVFGAYAGMDPSSLSSHSMLDSASNWDMQLSGMNGFITEPSSAWFMPFNMDPPEIGQEHDIFSNASPVFGMGGMPMNTNRNMGGNGGGH